MSFTSYPEDWDSQPSGETLHYIYRKMEKLSSGSRAELVVSLGLWSSSLTLELPASGGREQRQERRLRGALGLELDGKAVLTPHSLLVHMWT